MCELSIIIPIYKVERFVGKCLNSVYSSCSDENAFEVILINDGTPDNSLAIVEPFLISHSNCRLINEENSGISIARNTGMDAAKGLFVWFVDSDDWLLEGSVDYVLNQIRNNSEIDIFASSLLCYFEEEDRTKPQEALKEKVVLPGPMYFSHGYQTGAAQRSIYKLSFLKSNHLRFKPHLLHEDGLWGNTVYYLAKKVMLLDRYIYMYRKRSEGSIMSSISVNNAMASIEIHKQLTVFLRTYVAPNDQSWYERHIINTLWSIYSLTRSIWHTSEFNEFLKANRPYIRNACFSCLKVKGGWKNGLAMLLCPKLTIRVMIWIGQINAK